MNSIENLEARIQSLIEENLVKVVPGFKPEDLLSQKLANVMYAQIRAQGKKEKVAPNVYVIIAHPSKFSSWRKEPGFLEELANTLEIAGVEAGLTFASRVTISISTDPSLVENDIKVLASFRLGGMSETQGMETGTSDKKLDTTIPNNSFLILNGAEIIRLDQSVINIGRRLDNQVVIDDPLISRNHAQLRAIKGHFVIFDLNSTGGTYVNGERINQCILTPGDVLSLAGVTLIFGQDLPVADLKNLPTRPNTSQSSDKPAAIATMKDETSE